MPQLAGLAAAVVFVLRRAVFRRTVFRGLGRGILGGAVLGGLRRGRLGTLAGRFPSVSAPPGVLRFGALAGRLRALRGRVPVVPIVVAASRYRFVRMPR